MKRLAAAAMLLAAAACASGPEPYELKAVASNGQDLRGVSSTRATILESRQPAGIVSVRQSDLLSEYGVSFIVAAKNEGTEAAAFGPENVAASIGGRPAAVFDAGELDDKVRGNVRAFMRATDRGDPASTRAVDAGRPDVALEYTYNNYGGCPAGQGRCQIESPDVGSVYRHDRIDRERNLSNAMTAASVLEKDLAAIGSTLKPALVAPGAVGGGVVVIQPPRPGEILELVITFAGQPHRFSFEARPAA